MKTLMIAAVLVLMVFMSSCAQKAPARGPAAPDTSIKKDPKSETLKFRPGYTSRKADKEEDDL